MSEKDFKELGKQITDKLNNIREEIGAPIASFDAREQILSSAQFFEIASRIPLGKPLIINGEVSLVYIKDHLFSSKFDYVSQTRRTTNQCFTKGNRVHFYMCQKLKEMKRKGRADRYCVPKEFKDNKYKIDLSDEENMVVRLAWCKFCLEILLSDGNIRCGRNQIAIKDRAFVSGDSQEIINCVKGCHYERDDKFQRIKNFFQPFMEG